MLSADAISNNPADDGRMLAAREEGTLLIAAQIKHIPTPACPAEWEGKVE
jgi:hypothetical protein